MRITNTMLVTNFMNNLNNNMGKLGTLQNQMDSGKKFAHISEDPISVIYSQQARYRLSRLDHYKSNVATAQDWLRQAETSVLELGELMKSAYETTVDASTNVKGAEDLKNMAEYFKQLRDQVLNTLNTTIGDKFVFGGFNTTGHANAGENVPPFTVQSYTETVNYLDDGGNTVDDPANPGNPLTFTVERQKLFYNGCDLSDPANAALISQLKADVLTFDVGVGVDIQATVNGLDALFYGTDTADPLNPKQKSMFQLMDDLYVSVRYAQEFSPYGTAAPDIHNVNQYIPELQQAQSYQLARAAEIGGRTNRLDIIGARYEQDEINYTQMRSDAEDIDEAEAIMNFKMAESVYKAALSTGSYIIQPTLMDFLR